jgi:serine/threonine protein kinase
MPLARGDKLGPYEIVEAIGAGGMGEVFRARDTRLNRMVALKVSKVQFGERFEREARAIAALNHPNICQLYDVSHDSGLDFLVMEYLEGEALASRLKKGALPLEQALEYAIQIADALDMAHRKGMTHRDLKPGNVMLTNAGAKLLDFGLAKWKHAAAAPEVSLSQLPTETAPITTRGTILGTPPYMAPEQVEGKETDARADIFAFGAVLYEMATGRRAFEGQSQAGVMAKILESDPKPLRSLQPRSPAALERLVTACLAKDPSRRMQSAQDVKVGLEWIRDAAGEPTQPMGTAGGWRGALPWVGAAVALGLGAFAWLRGESAKNVAQTQPVRFEIPLPKELTQFTASIALSSDGRKLAFAARGSDGTARIWIRDLDSLEMHALPGTESVGELLIWSPDSQSIAFDSGGKLQKIDVSGGAATLLCKWDGFPFTGAWSKDGVILWGSVGGPLMRVSADGGVPTPVTALDPAHGDLAHTNPFFLPDGRHFLYLRDEGTNSAISAGSLDEKPGAQDPRRLIEGVFGPRYLPSSDGGNGLLLFRRGQTLMAQHFDAGHLTLSGSAVRALDAPIGDFLDSGLYSVSGNGTLAYRSPGNPQSQLTWFDDKGRPLEMVGSAAIYTSLALSQDGTQALVIKQEASGNHSVWLFDKSSYTSTPIANDPATDYAQVAAWSPDGRSMIFGAARPGEMSNLHKRTMDGSGDGELLLQSNKWKQPLSWSADGYVLFNVTGKGIELWALPLKDPTKAAPLLPSGPIYSDAQFSPDGRWVVYGSNESNRFEIYVKAFSDGHLGEGTRVTSSGGFRPRWSKDGKQLYYLGLDYKLMKMNLTLGPSVRAGAPTELFQAPRNSSPFETWAPSSDGKRFLFLVPLQQQDTPITVVLNWEGALNK